MFNVYYLVIITKKKLCSIFETKKATAFDSAGDTSLLDTENAMESLGGRYCSLSDTMELICQPFVRNKRKLKVFFYYVLSAPKHGNS
jgi:hypothetical protein